MPERITVRLFRVVALAIAMAVTSCEEEQVPAGKFQQVLPEPGATQVLLQPTFSWESSEAASEYRIIVSKDRDFGTFIIDENQIRGTSYIPSVPLEAGFLYFWKVEAVNAAGTRLADNAGLTFRTAIGEPAPSPGVSKYFVSPAGEDNPDRGTIARPFRSLAYASSRVPPLEDDTIALTAGVFPEVDPAIIQPRVNVIGAGEDRTILSSSGVTIDPEVNVSSPDFKLWYDGALIQLVSPHRLIPRSATGVTLPPENGNQVLSGFTIDGNNKSLKAGVWVENRNNVTMHHVTFRNVGMRGAVFAPGNKAWFKYPEHYMTGIRIFNCSFLNSGKDLEDESLGNLNIAQLDGAEIHHIHIEDNEGYGIKFIYDGYFRNTKIHDCTIRLNETDAKWGEDIAIELWNVGPGNEVYNIQANTWLSIVNHPEIFGEPSGTENMKISNIVVVDEDGHSSKEAIELGAPGVELSDSYFENKGIGVAIWDMGRSNIVVRNNLFYNTVAKTNWAGGAAVYVDNSRTWHFTDIQVVNNVFDNHWVSVKVKGSLIDDVTVRNNVFLNAQSAEIETEAVSTVATHNLKYVSDGPFSWRVSGPTVFHNNLAGDPLFQYTGHRRDSFYKPTAASICIDKGMDIGLPFKGNAPDIGRFEY